MGIKTGKPKLESGCFTPAVRASALGSILWHLSISLCFVFLIQGLKEMVSSIYFFNLVALGITVHALLLLLFLAPLLLPPITKLLGWRNSFIVMGAALIVFRLPLGLDAGQPFHLVFASLTFGLSSMLLSLMLALQRRERSIDPGIYSSQSITTSFGIALLALLVLVTLGRGTDASIIPKAAGPLLSPTLSGVLCGVLGLSLFGLKDTPVLDRIREGREPVGSGITGGAADSWAPAFGLGGLIFVSVAVLSQPLTMVEWLETGFPISLSFTVVTISLFIFSLFSGRGWLMTLRRTFAHPKWSIAGNAVLMLAALNAFVIRVPLMTAPAALTWMAMVDAWVLFDAFTDSSPFAGEEALSSRGRAKAASSKKERKWPSTPRRFASSVAVASGVFMTLLVLLSISENWSFVPLGFLLKGGLSYLMVAGISILAVCSFLCSKATIDEPSLVIPEEGRRVVGSPVVDAGKGTPHLKGSPGFPQRQRVQWLSSGVIAIVLVTASVAMTAIVYSRHVEEREVQNGGSIRVATYNIHHGFDNEGRVNPVPHYEVLKKIDADIVFMQECNSILPSEGTFDPSFYLAERLGMFLLKGADPDMGDPGLAILSRFPLSDARIHRLPSEDIQRTALSCKADLGGMEIWMMDVHLGLEAPEREEQIVHLKGMVLGLMNSTYSGTNYMIGGDLNTEPEEEMMKIINSTVFGAGGAPPSGGSLGLKSAWHTVPEDARSGPLDKDTYPTGPYDDTPQHIDYIFTSRGLEPTAAGMEDGGDASDHRPVWADIRLPS